MSLSRKFLADEAGATAIEYALIAGLISIVVATSGPAIGTALMDLYSAVAAAFDETN